MLMTSLTGAWWGESRRGGILIDAEGRMQNDKYMSLSIAILDIILRVQFLYFADYPGFRILFLPPSASFFWTILLFITILTWKKKE